MPPVQNKSPNYGFVSHYTPSDIHHSIFQDCSPDFNDVSSSPPPEQPQQLQQPQQRSIVLSNLPPKATLKDLTKVIRGGALVNIYQRVDQSVVVTFHEGASAFLTHAQSNGVYVHGKRIEAHWHDRQFNLPSHVATKISQGATRNLIIKGGADRLKERQVRDDLEHIHNLVVIDVRSSNNDVIISTNSIPNALFARTCMMSRMPYKTLKIYWMPDACAGPIVKFVPPNVKSVPTPAKVASRIKTNMFSLLTVDSVESDGESETDSSDGVLLSEPGSWD